MILVKTFLFIILVSASTEGRPQDTTEAKILQSDVRSGDNSFSFQVRTSDGFRHTASGYLENVDTKEESLIVKGSYSYTAPDGVVYTIDYVADKNGFQPHGTHIPQFGTPDVIIPEILTTSCVASLCGTGLG